MLVKARPLRLMDAFKCSMLLSQWAHNLGIEYQEKVHTLALEDMKAQTL